MPIPFLRLCRSTFADTFKGGDRFVSRRGSHSCNPQGTLRSTRGSNVPNIQSYTIVRVA